MEKMMMPAYYNVLSTEEMTYTEGGATATMSEALLCWLIPPYGFDNPSSKIGAACFSPTYPTIPHISFSSLYSP